MQACQWDPHDRTCAGWHVGKSFGQCDWSCRQHNKLSSKLHKQKFFFSRLKEMCSLIFVSAIKTVYQENIPFLKPIHMYVFIKNIIRKTVTGVFVFSSICTKLVNIKNKTILNMYYIRYLQKARRKKLLKKMDSSKKTIVKLSRKIDLRGGGCGG